MFTVDRLRNLISPNMLIEMGIEQCGGINNFYNTMVEDYTAQRYILSIIGERIHGSKETFLFNVYAKLREEEIVVSSSLMR